MVDGSGGALFVSSLLVCAVCVVAHIGIQEASREAWPNLQEETAVSAVATWGCKRDPQNKEWCNGTKADGDFEYSWFDTDSPCGTCTCCQRPKAMQSVAVGTGVVTAPMELKSDPLGSYVELPGQGSACSPGTCGSIALTMYCTEAIQVDFYALVLAPDVNSNSFYLTVGDTLKTIDNVGLDSQWIWSKRTAVFAGEPGGQQVVVGGRERNFKMRTMAIFIGAETCTFDAPTPAPTPAPTRAPMPAPTPYRPPWLTTAAPSPTPPPPSPETDANDNGADAWYTSTTLGLLAAPLVIIGLCCVLTRRRGSGSRARRARQVEM